MTKWKETVRPVLVIAKVTRAIRTQPEHLLGLRRPRPRRLRQQRPHSITRLSSTLQSAVAIPLCSDRPKTCYATSKASLKWPQRMPVNKTDRLTMKKVKKRNDSFLSHIFQNDPLPGAMRAHTTNELFSLSLSLTVEWMCGVKQVSLNRYSGVKWMKRKHGVSNWFEKERVGAFLAIRHLRHSCGCLFTHC